MKSPIQRQMELFSAALEHPAGPQRDAFLQHACADDAALLECVRTLLAGHSQAGSFLAQPAGPVGPSGTHLLPSTEKPGDKIGRYKLLQQIGEGGCGTVYMAEQEEPVRRRVALKVIRLGMDTKSVIARFEAERQALALMDHPNIAKVFDGGATENGRPYFVMELVRGIKITEYCDQAHLSTGERLQLFTQVCQAVQHAHQKGIIHRDIKPSNILVTVNDGVAVPKVIDFGIAKATDQRLTDKTYFTEFHAFIGTPAYTSPEQAEMSSLDIDTRSDIYSLGVLLYEMLTGHTPFPAERLLHSGLDEMRRIIREEEPPRPSTRLTTLPLADASELSRKRQLKIPALANAVEGDLDWIVMKALEKDRTRRYATSLDFAADIQRHLDNEPVHAGAPSQLYKFQKLVRRNKGAFAAAAAVFLALITGLGLTAWQAVRASRAEHAARAQSEQARADRDRAVLAESNATEKATVATNALLTANERMVKLNVAEGWRRVEEGDHFGALLPFAEAFALEQDKPERAEIHQMRLASVLQHCPKLVNVWSVGTNINHAEFNRDGSRLLTTSRLSQTQAVARIWATATGQPVSLPMEHAGQIIYVRWSNDDTKVVTTSEDKTARVWDAKTGRPLTPSLRHEMQVVWADFNSNSTRLVTTAFFEKRDGYDKSPEDHLSLWDLETSTILWRTNVALLEAQDFAIFSPDDNLIITPDEVRRVADAGLVQKLFIFPDTDSDFIRTQSPHYSSAGNALQSVNIHRVGFSPDLSRLFVASSPVRWYSEYRSQQDGFQGPLLETTNLSRTVASLKTPGMALMGTFSPDGRRLATANDGHAARVWSPVTGGAIGSPMHHTAAINSIAFSLDGRKLATATENGLARVWDAGTGEPSSPSLPHDAALVRASFSADGNQLSVVGFDGTVRTWDVRTADVPRFSWRGGGPVAHPDAKLMAVTLGDWPARIFSLRSGEPMLPPLDSSGFKLPSVGGTGFSSDHLAVLGPRYEGVDLFMWMAWDIATGKSWTNSVGLDRTLRADGYQRGGGFDQMSEDRRFIHFRNPQNRANGEDLIRVLETSSGRVVLEETLMRLNFSPDSSRAIGFKEGGAMMVWKTAEGGHGNTFGGNEPNRHWLSGSSTDGRMILTRGERQLELWNTDSGERVALLDVDRGRISPDGAWLATANARIVNLYAVSNKARLVATIRLPMEAKEDMEFSPDSRLLLTRDDFGTMRLWSIPQGELVEVIKAGRYAGSKFTPDGQGLLVYGGNDQKEVRLWKLSGTQRRNEDWLALARFFSFDQPEESVGLDSQVATRAKRGWPLLRTTNSLLLSWPTLRQSQPDAFAVSAVEVDAWERYEALRCETAKDWSNAVVHLTRLLETHPDSGDFLPRRAKAYVWLARNLATSAAAHQPTVTSLLERALADYNRTLAWVDRFPEVAKESRKVYLEPRGHVLRKLGRTEEANADFPEEKRIPSRAPGTSANLVDLTTLFNDARNCCAPSGVRKLGTSIEYDLRGVIVLTGLKGKYEEVHCPIQVTGMPIKRSARELHFLHDVDFDPHDMEPLEQKTGVFATLVIRLANGHSHRLELRFGEDVWYGETKSPRANSVHTSQIAWESDDKMLRLFQRTWMNPTPEVPIESVDFIAGDIDAYPMLYAITVEP